MESKTIKDPLIQLDVFSYLKLENNVLSYQNSFFRKEENFHILKFENNQCLINFNNQKLTLIRKNNPYLFEEKENKEVFFLLGEEVFSKIKNHEQINSLQKQKQEIEKKLFSKNIWLNENKHLLINSENYVALQLLLKSLKEKIDCIIIDPPYNTQNKNMKYNDVFLEGSEFDWKIFMKNRLLLAHKILSEEGVIFIHINDYEYANLKWIMDGVFGKQNFIENFIWKKNSIKNNSKTTANNHEYILCYAKNKNVVESLNYFRKRKEGFSEIEKLKKETIKQFIAKHNIEINFKKENKNNELVDINIENINFIDLNCFSSTQQKEIIFLLEKQLKDFYRKNKHLKGISQYKFVEIKNGNLEIFRISDVSAPNKKGNFFEIIHPDTLKPCKNPSGGFRYNKETFEQHLKNNLFFFGKDENTVPQFKRYLKDREFEVCNSVIENYDEGYNDLKNRLPNANFNNPKPVSLIYQLLEMINKKEFIVLDFFAGSGTILESVEKINVEQNKNIQCVAITNNENDICNKITKERFKAILKEKEFDYYEI